MAIERTGRIVTGDELLDLDLRDIDIVTGATGSFLYAATGQTGGISVWRLSATGQLAQPVDSTYFPVSGMAVGPLDAVAVDGQAQLILSGVGDGKLIRYRIGEDGGLGGMGKLDLPGATVQNHAALAAASLSDGRTVLYTVNAQTGAFGGWLSRGNGALDTGLGAAALPAPLDPTGPVLLQLAEAGGRSFLLAADAGLRGVHSYRIAGDTGALVKTGMVGAADGLGVALPTALETVSAHGASWVVLAAAGSNSLSVMRLEASGVLVPTDHVIDTLATRFAGVTALKVIEADGHVFVLAGGSDDGLSLFRLLPDGQLVHMQSLAHDTGLGLDNVTAIAATRIGDRIQIFVSSGGDAGLSQFSLPLSGLGRVIEAPPEAGNRPLDGTAAGDLILGAGGTGTLRGQAGDDILVSGAGGGTLIGGGGADIFVLQPGTAPLRITDFQPGIDRLDLSRFPMLRDPGQLALIPTETGITLLHGTTRIEILRQGGGTLTMRDLWPEGFATPDRIGFLPAGPVLGGAGADRMEGTAGSDRFFAGAGNDTLYGGGGADELHGEDGDDVVHGGIGHDRLYGGNGYDVIHGGVGNDRVWGGNGRDKIYLGAGNDVFHDSPQNDVHGADLVRGGAGNDIFYDGGGNDTYHGEAGADLFVFSSGHGGDRIADFTPGQDHIRFDIAGLRFADLVFRDLGDDMRIETGSGTILVFDLDPADLGADDFLFV